MGPDQFNGNIAKIIRYSQTMLRHAEDGEWDIVAEEEIIRRRLIDNYFSKPLNTSTEPFIAAAIQELLEVNNKLEKLSAAARDDAMSIINSITTGRTAINAYRENSI